MTLEEFLRSHPEGRFEMMVYGVNPDNLTVRIKSLGDAYIDGIVIRVKDDDVEMLKLGHSLPMGWSVVEGEKEHDEFFNPEGKDPAAYGEVS
jgi:hypothetical protein